MLAGLLCIACSLNVVAFELIDATLYRDKPDLSPHGFQKALVIYESSLWERGENKNIQPRNSNIESVVKKIADFNGKYIVLDVEVWEQSPDPEFIVSMYSDLLERIAVDKNRHTLGLYGVLPIRNYWGAISRKTGDKFTAWTKENDSRSRFASKVGILYPSLYTFYADESSWLVYARENIREARRMAAGKPVIPFIWPQYHESNTSLRNAYIDKKFWRFQLETLKDLADGVVIWGGWDLKKKQPLPWNENLGWWKETKTFAKQIKSPPLQPTLILN